MSTRTPIFRQFPRVGIPPHYVDWDDYARARRFMIDSGVLDDPTFLWYDVRPHPQLGTVEVRVCDSQTRLEHTVALAALVQAMVKELVRALRSRTAPVDVSMADARREQVAGRAPRPRTASSSTCPGSDRVATKALARRLVDRLREHAQDLGSADELDGIEDLMRHGNGAERQVVVYEANHDLREVMAEIVEATGA